MLRRCMDYGKMFGKVFMSTARTRTWSATARSTRARSRPVWPSRAGRPPARSFQIARDIEIAKLTGAKLHIQHISTAHGLELVRAGKAPVSR